MKILTYRSVVGPRLTAFVKLRRALGYELRSQVYGLRQFDRVLLRQMCRPGPVTRQVVESFLRTLDGLQPLTRRNRLSTIRQFLLYLKQFEPDTFIPDHSLAPPRSLPRAPYIYTLQEIQSLLRTAALYPFRYPRRRWLLYPTLIGLIYVTGMRISEALALTLADIDWRASVLRIRKTKFHKSRLVPFTSKTSERLHCYLVARAERGHRTAPEEPLFVTEQGLALSHSTVEQAFRRIVLRARLPGGRRAPRIHDLRHTQATRRLYLWYREGKDVQALLPALVTYLGHSQISSTDLYVTATSELLEETTARFERQTQYPPERRP